MFKKNLAENWKMFLAKTKKLPISAGSSFFSLIIVLLTEDVTGNILIFMTTQFFMIFLLTQHLLSVI